MMDTASGDPMLIVWSSISGNGVSYNGSTNPWTTQADRAYPQLRE